MLVKTDDGNLGVSEEQLPKLFESYEVVGTLKEDIAEELGLSKESRSSRELETMRQQR